MADAGNKPSETSRRTFLKIGGGFVVGAAVASAVAIPLLSGKTTTSTTTETATGPTSTVTGPTTTVTGPEVTATSTVTSTAIDTTTVTQTGSSSSTTYSLTNGLLTLSSTEAAEVAAIAETIIPTDSNGPGANEAGVLFFIDHQLATEYGQSGWMYMTGAFVPPNLSGPITVDGITYSGGSALSNASLPTNYQYNLNLREFWRAGLAAFEGYCNSAYGGNFETLSASDQVQALSDLANNKPTDFNGIVPSDFFYDVFFLTWSGFLMDPMYGGNQGMVGWSYVGFNGTNTGNAYGEGLTVQQLMVATTPTRLQPQSLAQFQQAAGLIPGGSS